MASATNGFFFLNLTQSLLPQWWISIWEKVLKRLWDGILYCRVKGGDGGGQTVEILSPLNQALLVNTDRQNNRQIVD